MWIPIHSMFMTKKIVFGSPHSLAYSFIHSDNKGEQRFDVLHLSKQNDAKHDMLKEPDRMQKPAAPHEVYEPN